MNSLNRKNFLEVDRRKVIMVGNSLYVGIPDHLKRAGVQAGDDIVFLRAPDFPDTIITSERSSSGDGAPQENKPS